MGIGANREGGGQARMMAAGAAAIGVLVLVIGPSVITWQSGPDSAVRPSAPYRILKLDDGRAGEVAVSRSDQLLVKWRKPGAKRWSRPVLIDSQRDHYFRSANVRVAGETLAIRAEYRKAPLNDEEAWDGDPTVVFVACTIGDCDTSEPYRHLLEPACDRGSCVGSRPESKGVSRIPELNSSGTKVFFGETEKGYVVWQPSTGFREVRRTGLPTVGAIGAPMLAPDGTFRIVSGRLGVSGCGLSLFTTTNFAPDFQTQTVVDIASRSDGCATTLESFADDYVIVHTSPDRDPVYLVREGSEWREVATDPSGRVRYDKAKGRTAFGQVVRTGFWHWREVITASPDGRRLVTQVHFPGASTWSEPQVVGEVSPGVKCFEIAPTSEPASDPFYVTMRCRSRPSPSAPWKYVSLHAITEDGVNWDSFVGTDLPTRVGEDLLFEGNPAYRWSSEGGVTKVDLPVPAKSTISLTKDDTYVLVTMTPESKGCRLTAQVAEPGAREWSSPIPNELPYLPAGDDCVPRAQVDGATVRIYPSPPGSLDWSADVSKRSGEWEIVYRVVEGP